MLKHRFGANYQALGQRSFQMREDLPVVNGLEQEDYWALWERMREGESYDEIKQVLKAENLSLEDIKQVMRWLEDQGMRYFPLYQDYKRARVWVYIGLILMVIGAIVAYYSLQNGYQGLLPMTPFLAGVVVFILSWGKFRSLRASL
ncbi:MAG TPA: hypothetical protein DCE41_25495 [Cytophagales bacterium]|nr:hypothetical protein [Cytophagales bacterium]HAA20827.1 hypothetical protein [Cytophagales bacterium]HAP59116.1 hypothetical protein [Cytophagales bacterium]